MDKQKIREPKQQRSIEKRNKILEAGYQLFCEKGYYKTNTAEIAKLAGVSTGIIYSYFEDKKDIFMRAIEDYASQVDAPIYDQLEKLKHPVDITAIVKQSINQLVRSHTLTKSVHEEMQALAHTDGDISELFCRYRSRLAHRLVDIMENLDIRPENAYEKALLIIIILENLTHEMVYHKHDYYNYDVLVEEAVMIITGMLIDNK